MRLDKLPGTTGRRENLQSVFGGLDCRKGAEDGSINKMLNMCGDDRGIIRSRDPRYREVTLEGNPNGIYGYGDMLIYVDGKKLYVNGQEVTWLEDSPKTFADMTGRVIIWPDKIIINVKYTIGYASTRFASLAELQEYYDERIMFFEDGKAYRVNADVVIPGVIETRNNRLYLFTEARGFEDAGLEAYGMEGGYEEATGVVLKSEACDYGSSTANALQLTGVDWAEMFKPGDGITISGCVDQPENNKTAIVREINGDTMYFDDNVFTLGGGTSYTESGTLNIETVIPELENIFCHGNRLWGTGKNDRLIYGSKLGDPENFNVFDGLSTDSVFLDAGSAGPWTGGCSYGGYALFFKSGEVWRLYGSTPENFSLVPETRQGVERGSERSLATAGNALYYLGREGVIAYNRKGNTALAGEALEPRGFTNALGGSDGRRYWMCAYTRFNDKEIENGAYCLYVLDTETGNWYQQSIPAHERIGPEYGSGVLGFARTVDSFYMLTSSGEIWAVSYPFAYETLINEGTVSWFMRSSEFPRHELGAKTGDRLYMRAAMYPESSMTVKIRYNTGDEWVTLAEMSCADETSENYGKRHYEIPVLPVRADRYDLQIEGTGPVEFYGISRSEHTGSHYRRQTGGY